jgi:copper chaperone CopZ
MRVMPRGKTRTVLLIQGMKGAACRETVTAALESVSGVKEVEVSLYRGRAAVEHEPGCDTAELLRAVSEAGYLALPLGN